MLQMWEDLAAVCEQNKQGVRSRDLTRRLPRGHHWPKTDTFCLVLDLTLTHKGSRLSRSLSGCHMKDFLCWWKKFPAVGVFAIFTSWTLWTCIECILVVLHWELPYNSPIILTRTKSIEALSLNILSSSHKELRVPICAIPKHWMIKQTTWSAVLSVVQWSFAYLAARIFPGARHDGSPWHKGRSKRAAQAGKPCPRGVLLQSYRSEETGACIKVVLHLPAWSLGCLF